MGAHHHHHHHSLAEDHGPHHAAQLSTQGPAFRLGILLNLAYVAAEAVAGLLTGSMALLADAGHNLSDVLGLALAWGAVALASRPASERYTFGLGRSTILAALANAAILLVACGAIAVEALDRLRSPAPVQGGIVMAVAGLGLLVNLGTAALFHRDQAHDLNMRGAYLHMMADAAVSGAVVLAGGIILLTGWHWVDPALGLLVVVMILRSTWGLLRDSVAAALDAVPAHIDPARVQAALARWPGVADVHHLHIWPLATSQVALTAHLVMPGGHPGDAVLAALAADMEAHHGIAHATFQIETGSLDPPCPPCGHGVVAPETAAA